MSNMNDEKRLKLAYKMICNLEQQLQDSQNSLKQPNTNNYPVAVIGVACRYPNNISGPEALWKAFVDKKNVVKEIPKTRWDIDAIYSADLTEANKTYCRKGAFFETIDEFDSLFFNISYKEAERMDPQQRLFLQGCWEAFEDAGLNDKALNEAKCGVYAGSLNCDYSNVLNETPHNLDLFELMGTQSSILSARISYLLNLKGPSITIDTACSSSLVAIDLAVKAIQRGDIDIALAGGVHLYITPNLFIMMSKAQMLSEDGQCKAFDDSANGFVPGEGMAVVALKKLEKALEDRDNIYGVILGGFSNQDGKTNGITAPSSLSQSTLLQEAYRRLEVNPESIGYIETHGTGTKLGDPIEFEALTTSFRKYTDKKQFCSIGSSKTNFGHTLSAAGVTGFLKALLALKNQKIPATLNFQKSNEHLDYLESPFFVNTDMIEWPNDGNCKRRSAVSSFGFSGTNVHLVLEEAPTIVHNEQYGHPPYYLIPLSAKTKTALAKKINDLKNWLDSQTLAPNLADISLTLLRGRCHFRFRTAFVVANLPELNNALKQWQLDDGIKPFDQPPDLAKDQAPNNQALIDSLSTFANFDEANFHVKLQEVGQLYVDGYDLHWDSLLSQADAHTLSLPTYPFENEKHWITSLPSKESTASTQSMASENKFSFVDSNESTLASQCYQKTFTGNEFYLKDHIVNLQKMLPGVAYLEMARSSGNLCNRPYRVTKIENVVWKTPIVVDDGPQTVRISLHPQQDRVEFQVFSTTGDDSKGTVHATGQLTYSLETEYKDEFIDIETLQNELVNFVSQQQCYRIFSAKGLRYGSSFRRLLGLSHKDNRALATIEGIDDDSESDSLHPGIMDAATQAVLVLVRNLDTTHQQYLPYSIESLELKNPLTRRCFSYVVRRDKTDDRDPSEIFDAILADENGKILLNVKGLHLIPVKGAACPSIQAAELLYFTKSWQQNTIAPSVHNSANTIAQQYSPIILLGDSNAIKENIDRTLLDQNHPSIVATFSDRYRCLDERNFTFDQNRYDDVEKLVDTFIKYGANLKHIVAVFDSSKADTNSQKAQTTMIPVLLTTFVKALMHRHLKNEIRLVVIHRGDLNQQSLSSPISAFFKTLQLENPKFIGKTVEIQGEGSNKQVTNYLLDELFSEDLSSQPVRYNDGKRLVSILTKIDNKQYFKKPGKDEIYLNSEGVYLITGGAKGIGLAIAKHLCATVKPSLILTGRSAPTQEIQKALAELNSGYDDEQVIYLQADVSDLNDMEYVMHKIKSRWGRLNGIIHSAGINRDAFILKQDIDDLQAVLKPKIQGTLNLHQVSQSEPLDFFILFSSIAAVFGNSGQSDYAFANAFMDDFANYREQQRKQSQCSGKTVSINWPLWEEGGMQLDSATEKNMDDLFGMRAIDAQIGSKVIANSLNMPFPSLLVIYGNEEKINQTLISSYVTEGNKKAIVFEQLNDSQKNKVRHESERFLKLLLSDEMKIPYEKIESSAPFENYGLDSVVYMQLNRKLEERFGKISKTLFYEYQNIASLASYFAESHLPEIIEIAELKIDQSVSGKTPEKPKKVIEEYQPKVLPRFFESSMTIPPVVQHKPAAEVAIIGLSGLYPMANDLDEFWTNLINGKDCVQEIPKNRWDHRRYFNPQRGIAGKTYCKWGGFIEGHDTFDPLFFNISPKEAALIDPQERLFLQVAWQTIADAGYTGRSLANSTVGVYAGVMWSQYQLLGVDENYQSGGDVPESLISSVANRISYFFDFHGPSIGLDTMCSSSLTAIHLACDAIRNGECDYALTGGVNLIVHPNKYLRLAQGNFSSTDGRCRSFGIGGDGYVPGEGVGAVLLKPLDQALVDRDHIYGVIKGSQINHGGKTNGYTVPNPVLQGELIAKTLAKAGVDSQTISYVEAHGTGTSLGDPIEITGLTQGFGTHDEHQFCALGSVKSNIGHLESAAGISALTKVLLQMKHKQLVPTLHCEETNPSIDLDTSPFYLQKSVCDWIRPVKAIDGNQQEYPRRAAISSFGAGGSNAHMIVEEAPCIARSEITGEQPRIFVFSAKDKTRLENYIATALPHFTKASTQQNARLIDIAYTLQVGRDEENERLAFVADSYEALCEKLQECLKENSSAEKVFRGSVARLSKNHFLPTGLSGLEYVTSLIKHQDFEQIAAFWAQGGSIDWHLLYDNVLPYRVPLPAAPFDNLTFWVPRKDELNRVNAPSDKANTALRAFIDTNTSTFEKQSYQKTFSGHEFYLKDHVIQGQLLLPASAFLEMAYAAASLAHSKTVCGFSNLIWKNPLIVEENSVACDINLYPNQGQADFEICLHNPASKPYRYCTGTVDYAEPAELPEDSAQLNLTDIVKSLNNTIDPETFYRELEQNGFYYGESFRSLKSIQFNNFSVFAEIVIPDTCPLTGAEIGLHPIEIDAAFQAMKPLLSGFGGESASDYVPHSIDSLTIVHNAPARACYVYGERSANAKTHDNPLFNIKLLDKQGNIVVAIKDFAVMPFRLRITPSQQDKILLLREHWTSFQPALRLTAPAKQAQTLVIQQDRDLSISGKNYISIHADHTYRKINQQRYDLPLDDKTAYSKLLDEISKDDAIPENIIYLLGKNNTAQSLLQFLASLTYLLQAYSKKQYLADLRIAVLYPRSESIETVLIDSVSGFFKSLHKENPLWQGFTVCYDQHISDEQLLRLTEQTIQNSSPDRQQISLVNGKLAHSIREFVEIKSEELPNVSELTKKLKRNGVYLITGGVGGLGLLFAEYLSKNYSSKLILLGRSQLNEVKHAFIKRLNDLGSEVLYLQADVSDKESMENALEKARARFGEINGIIHSAGIIRDRFVINKSLEDIQLVLSPKVQGSLILDEVTASENLDFFILFSSLAAAIGNAGQTDYATANAFQDSFSSYRNRLVDQHLRHGKTISINWPLWREGGMQLDEAMIRQMQKSLGLSALETYQGLQIFEQILSLPYSEVIVAQGTKEGLRHLFENKALQQQTEPTPTELIPNNLDSLRTTVHAYIKNLIASEIQWPASKIADTEPFGQYGIDSVMTLNLTAELAEHFGDLPKTLFFEFKSVNELGEYLINNHYNKAFQLIADHKVEHLTGPTTTDAGALPFIGSSITRLTHSSSTSRRFIHSNRDESSKDGIAIIGISGRYPQANNIEEFYQNLRAGKDCITEIPKQRWNSDIYFHKDRNQVGKCYSKWGGFLDDIDQFDPLFFNISPSDAITIDPQERLFLESVWNTIEDAGLTKTSLKQYKVGVFAGVMWDHYQLLGVDSTPTVGKKYPGSSYASIANRVSYWFDFDGPSLAIDTMCSSSLTAIHYACESIKHGECDIAIAGGVNLAVHPIKYLQLAGSQFLSTDGKCRSFGEGGDGYVPGEGVGSILLKPLRQAQQDGDHIYAVIRGSVINHGGKSNGFHVPNLVAQGNLIQRGLQKFSIDPNDISYIEAHGTGTPIGDPIEIEGLKRGFAGVDTSTASCSIGSVKSNIGHLEAASGMASLTKVILQMKYKKLFPSLHAETTNANINFDKSIFKIQTDLADWPQIENKPYLAGLSSFGAGGSNAFLILESVNSKSRNVTINNYPYQIVPLSAKTPGALGENAKSLAQLITSNSHNGDKDFDNISLENIAFTLQRYREPMEERVAIVTDSLTDLVKQLTRFYKNDGNQEHVYTGSLDFVVSGKLPSTEKQIACDEEHALQSLCEIAQLWVNGFSIDFAKILPDLAATRISLPTYRFQSKSFWYSGKSVSATNRSDRIAAPLVDRVNLDKSTDTGFIFKTLLTPSHPLLSSHLFRKQPLLPGMACLEMVSEAINVLSPVNGLTFNNVSWHSPLYIDKSDTEIFIAIDKRNEGYSYEIWTEQESKKVIHSKGTVQHLQEIDSLAPQHIDSSRTINHSQNAVNQDEFYRRFAQYGLDYNNDFRCITKSYQHANDVLAFYAVSEDSQFNEGYLFNPAILDSALQSFVLFQDYASDGLKLPFAVEKISLIKSPPNHGMTLTCQTGDEGNHATIADGQGNPCVIFSNINFRTLQPEFNLKISKKTISSHPNTSVINAGKDSKIAVEYLIKGIFSKCLNIQSGDLKSTTTFDQYGLESVMAVEITKLLEATFGDLPVTLLFEYPTVNDLVSYLLTNHTLACEQLVQNDDENRRDTLPPHQNVDDKSLPDQTLNAVQKTIKDIFTQQLSVERDALKLNLSFDQYGLESVAALAITQALEDIFGPLPATTLFEYPSLSKLSEYLLAEFPEQCGRLSFKDAPLPFSSTSMDSQQLKPLSLHNQQSSSDLWRKVATLSEHEVDNLLADLLNTERKPLMEQEDNEA